MKSFFNFLKEYIKIRIKGAILLCIFGAVFASVFSLYNLKTDAVWYAIEICFFFGVLYFIVAFIFQYRRHLSLQRMKKQITLGLEHMPAPENIFEKDYQELLSILSADRTEIITSSEAQTSEMTDYYTMWVHQIKIPIAGMKLHFQKNKSQENTDLLLELFRIEQYVDMVLNYLRVEHMSSDLDLEEYNLEDIVRQAVRKYAGVFVKKKIALDLQPCSCMVLTDEKWLSFVIEQILSNSLKYTKEGCVAIYLDAVLPKTLVIEDTGIGIQPSDLPRVFERGFTGYNGRTDKSASGIGLYLCKKILAKLSHSISIESAVNRGTKVKITMETKKIGPE